MTINMANEGKITEAWQCIEWAESTLKTFQFGIESTKEEIQVKRSSLSIATSKIAMASLDENTKKLDALMETSRKLEINLKQNKSAIEHLDAHRMALPGAGPIKSELITSPRRKCRTLKNTNPERADDKSELIGEQVNLVFEHSRKCAESILKMAIDAHEISSRTNPIITKESAP